MNAQYSSCSTYPSVVHVDPDAWTIADRCNAVRRTWGFCVGRDDEVTPEQERNARRELLRGGERYMVENRQVGPTHRRLNKKSIYRGVKLQVNRASTCWRAAITVDDKQINLGTFNDQLSAAHAYDAAARVYHGAKARLNFPDPARGITASQEGD